MKKIFLTYILIFVIGMVLIYLTQTNIFTFTISFREFLIATHIYLAIFTITVCLSLYFLQKSKKFEHQIGFFYLFSVPVKIILFVVVFQKQFSDQGFYSNLELLNFLFVMLLSLFFEVLFVAKILNISNAAKNVE